jgi:hypothetical protein
MTRIADGSVSIQISSEAVPAMPSWFGEVVAFARVLTHQGTLTAISEQVRFAHACKCRNSVDEILYNYASEMKYILFRKKSLTLA